MQTAAVALHHAFDHTSFWHLSAIRTSHVHMQNKLAAVKRLTLLLADALTDVLAGDIGCSTSRRHSLSTPSSPVSKVHSSAAAEQVAMAT